jgi:HK97 family phage prohead protease
MPPTNDEREVRCLMAGVELRAAAAGGKGPGTVVGYAAVFDKMSQDLGYFVERIQRGAFAGCLAQDVRALKNHDSNYLLGRNKSGTLRMGEDELGLRVEIDLPDTQVGRDTAEEIARGDMDGMSFSFVADVDQWDYSGTVPVRTLVKVRDLYDVGPVVYPAYTDTSAAMRSLEAARPRPAETPAPEPRAYDPSEVIQFRFRIEQAAVLPALE